MILIHMAPNILIKISRLYKCQWHRLSHLCHLNQITSNIPNNITLFNILVLLAHPLIHIRPQCCQLIKVCFRCYSNDRHPTFGDGLFVPQFFTRCVPVVVAEFPAERRVDKELVELFLCGPYLVIYPLNIPRIIFNTVLPVCNIFNLS